MSSEASGGYVVDLGNGIITIRADNPSALTLSGTQTYVVGEEAVVVLDPGPDDSVHLDRVGEVIGERAVAAVCLTHSHRDHAAAAGEAAERWGTLRASRETLERVGLGGEPLADGDSIGLGPGFVLRAISTPGHSGDHLCYLVESTRDLFTGDLILGSGSSIIVHPDGSVRDYLTSLERLVPLRPARLLPGHGPVVTATAKRLEACRVHRIERTKHVLRAVEAGAGTVKAIREAVYWELPAAYHSAAELSIQAYLAYLREEGHDMPPGSD